MKINTKQTAANEEKSKTTKTKDAPIGKMQSTKESKHRRKASPSPASGRSSKIPSPTGLSLPSVHPRMGRRKSACSLYTTDDQTDKSKSITVRDEQKKLMLTVEPRHSRRRSVSFVNADPCGESKHFQSLQEEPQTFNLSNQFLFS